MKDISYGLSATFHLIGYSLFLLGVSCNAWKFQTGYTFGLWFRCDKRGCSFYEVDFNDCLTVIRTAVAVTALMFTIGVLCLLLEICLKLANSQSGHLRRIRFVIDVTTFLSEISIALILASYGYLAIKDKQKLPRLLWGFAITGVGTIVAFIGSILRTMGPVKQWGRFVCLTKRTKKNGQMASKNQRASGKSTKAGRNHDPKGGKRYVRPECQKKDIIVTRKTNQCNRILPYLAPGVPYDDSYESLLSTPEMSTKATHIRYDYEEIVPPAQEPIFFKADHNTMVARPYPVRRPENQYQISVNRSPRRSAFRTLPTLPKGDPLEDTVVVHSDSAMTFDRPSSTPMHSFVYDWS